MQFFFGLLSLFPFLSLLHFAFLLCFSSGSLCACTSASTSTPATPTATFATFLFSSSLWPWLGFELFFFSSRRLHTRYWRDWSSDVCSSDLGESEVRRMVAEYDRRRKVMWRRFNDLGLACFEPRGAFYCFPNISSTGLSDEEFAERLLVEQKVDRKSVV